MRVCRARLGSAALVLAILFSTPAAAHLLAPSMLEAEERGGDRVAFRWTTPAVVSGAGRVEPLVPEAGVPDGAPEVTRASATFVARWTMRCPASLVGQRLGAGGLGSSRTQVLLRIRLADGRVFETVLTSERASYVVPERASLRDTARSYFRLGVQHIVTGFDHLAFVLGLLLLVRDRRRLLFTVTAFTAGHSVTLAAAVLGLVRVPPAPVEAAIALSILLVAVELARGADEPPTALGRFPWVTAAAFGLLHGLGFAGALTQVGLPRDEIPAALLFFNFGIEAGQIVFIAVVLVVGFAFRGLAGERRSWLEAVPVYGIGTASSYWLLERLFAIVST